MEITVKHCLPEKQKTPCLVVGIFENGKLSQSADSLNTLSDGYLKKIIRQGDIEGKTGSTLLLQLVPNTFCDRILLVGCGKEKNISGADYRTICSASAKALQKGGMSAAISFLPELKVKSKSLAWQIRTEALEVFETDYRFDEFKSESTPPAHPLEKLTLAISSKSTMAEAKQALEQASAISSGINLAKDLGNCPPNICHPNYLADQARQLGRQFDSLSVEILEEAEMETLGMGSLLSVSRGSEQPAKLITLNYSGAKKTQKPIVLVGKGVTFDSGGISLKPGPGMDEMKFDMCGAASVFGVVRACAELNLPINLVAIIPSVENMPDGTATRPGDIVTTMSGQTVEILNTDAEGRLILCDALTYADKFNPDVVIDIATLTGACIVALGKHTSGLLSNDDSLANDLFEAGQNSGDKCWRLPIWDEYQKQLDSNFADMANIGGQPAGTITAACFLSKFTTKYQWAHLDIAGVAWLSGNSKGSTGRPVPLLMQYLFNRCKK